MPPHRTAYHQRAQPVGAPKSSAGKHLRRIWGPGRGVICSPARPDITPAEGPLACQGVICRQPCPYIPSEPAPRWRANLFTARQLEPEERPGRPVICGALSPHITSGGLRWCYTALSRCISPAHQGQRSPPSSLFSKTCRELVAFDPDYYAARTRSIISTVALGFAGYLRCSAP